MASTNESLKELGDAYQLVGLIVTGIGVFFALSRATDFGDQSRSAIARLFKISIPGSVVIVSASPEPPAEGLPEQVAEAIRAAMSSLADKMTAERQADMAAQNEEFREQIADATAASERYAKGVIKEYEATQKKADISDYTVALGGVVLSTVGFVLDMLA